MYVKMWPLIYANLYYNRIEPRTVTCITVQSYAFSSLSLIKMRGQES
jgi:hypothetical protein